VRLPTPTVFILAPAAIGAVGAGMVYAQQSPRMTVLVLSQSSPDASGPEPLEGPSPGAFASALRRRGIARPLLREGSGVLLPAEGAVDPGAVARAREALDRGREYLRLLQLPEAESSLAEAARGVRGVGTPDAWEIRREADIALGVVLLEAGRREAALRTFMGLLSQDPRLVLDPVRYSPFVQEALDQARATVALLPRGGIRVETTPAGLDVWIDGRLAGRSPVAAEDLVSGDHVVAVVAPGRPAWSRVVGAPASEAATIHVLQGAGADPVQGAVAIGRILEADRVVILSGGPDGRIRGLVAEVSTGRPGVARESDSEENLVLALEEELGFRAAGVADGNGQIGSGRGERAPWYEKWWVYAIGVGIVGGAITTMALVDSGGDDTDDLN